jgi:hypothetical protein
MEKSFDSPTTPGLRIDFPNYLIELVCLNCDRKLTSRFWKSSIYWTNKYKREIKGVHNLRNMLESFACLLNFDNPLAQTVLIDIIKRTCIKSLSAKKTVTKIVGKLKVEYEKERQRRLLMAHARVLPSKNDEQNSRYLDDRSKNKLSILRELENSGEEKIG